jgi:3-hydroxybutyryl-CoA dehydrogenase
MDPDKVTNVGILGAGVMGISIAQVFAQHGYTVKLYDLKQEALERALHLINSTLMTLVDVEGLSSQEISAIMDRIHPTKDLASTVEDADFVIEAVFEEPSVKKKLFSQLSGLCSKDTVLASNTSGLDIFNLVEIYSPERLIITHWFSPAHIIPLVEIIPEKKTSQEVIAFTQKLLENLGKKTIVLKEFVPAFIVNRIQNAINSAVFEIIENGWADPEDIDLAVKNTLGIRLPVVGVAQALDFNGLDLIHTINERLGRKSTFISEKVEQGLLGAKTSKGIYDYGDRSEGEILKKRDDLYLKMLAHLEKIKAFEPV